MKLNPESSSPQDGRCVRLDRVLRELGQEHSDHYQDHDCKKIEEKRAHTQWISKLEKDYWKSILITPVSFCIMVALLAVSLSIVLFVNYVCLDITFATSAVLRKAWGFLPFIAFCAASGSLGNVLGNLQAIAKLGFLAKCGVICGFQLGVMLVGKLIGIILDCIVRRM